MCGRFLFVLCSAQKTTVALDHMIDQWNRYRKYNWRFLAAVRAAELLITAFRNLFFSALWENDFPTRYREQSPVDHSIMRNSSSSAITIILVCSQISTNDTGREIILSMQIVYVSIITVVSTANRELACNSWYRKFISQTQYYILDALLLPGIVAVQSIPSPLTSSSAAAKLIWIDQD